MWEEWRWIVLEDLKQWRHVHIARARHERTEKGGGGGG